MTPHLTSHSSTSTIHNCDHLFIDTLTHHPTNPPPLSPTNPPRLAVSALADYGTARKGSMARSNGNQTVPSHDLCQCSLRHFYFETRNNLIPNCWLLSNLNCHCKNPGQDIPGDPRPPPSSQAPAPAQLKHIFSADKNFTVKFVIWNKSFMIHEQKVLILRRPYIVWRKISSCHGRNWRNLNFTVQLSALFMKHQQSKNMRQRSSWKIWSGTESNFLFVHFSLL